MTNLTACLIILSGVCSTCLATLLGFEIETQFLWALEDIERFLVGTVYVLVTSVWMTYHRVSGMPMAYVGCSQ